MEKRKNWPEWGWKTRRTYKQNSVIWLCDRCLENCGKSVLVEKNKPGGGKRGGKNSDFSRVDVRQKVEKEM